MLRRPTSGRPCPRQAVADSARQNGPVSQNPLGDRLRALRLERHLTQRALAKAVKVTFPHISKIESGDEVPSERLVIQLADELQADRDELLLLARRMPEDLTAAVLEKADRAPEFLRSWRSGKISDEDIDNLLGKAREQP
jgi:transcriptional regulator with XRE-family HTH domain